MIFNKLKNNIFLNIISLLGYTGFVVLIYYLLFSRNIHDSFSFIPRFTLEHFWKYWTFSVKVFILLIIFAVLEPICVKVFRLYKIKSGLVRYFELIPCPFFVIGFLFAVLSVFLYWCLYIPPDLCD